MSYLPAYADNPPSYEECVSCPPKNPPEMSVSAPLQQPPEMTTTAPPQYTPQITTTAPPQCPPQMITTTPPQAGYVSPPTGYPMSQPAPLVQSTTYVTCPPQGRCMIKGGTCNSFVMTRRHGRKSVFRDQFGDKMVVKTDRFGNEKIKIKEKGRRHCFCN